MNQKIISQEWWKILQPVIESTKGQELKQFLLNEYSSKTVYPKAKNIFKALNLVKPEEVKVVIIGQDPYHNGLAHGLAFSAQGTKRPKSLQVILKEIDKQLFKSTSAEDFSKRFKGSDLTSWAEQGVLLLNSCFTVREGEPNSHKDKGWEEIVDTVLLHLIQDKNPKVFITWGKNAEALLENKLTEEHTHLWLKSGHPATSFYGKDTFSNNLHFIKTNKFLEDNKLSPINWEVKLQINEVSNN